MPFIINIPFTNDIKDIHKFGLEQSKSFKGIFLGDVNKGAFDFESSIGKFTGKYIVKKNIIEITLNKKPFLIPNIVIENFLRMHIK